MKTNTRIPPHTLVKWLDHASRYVARENDPANRAIDAVKLSLVTYLHGKNFDTGYLFERVDEAIDALRKKNVQCQNAQAGER